MPPAFVACCEGRSCVDTELLKSTSQSSGIVGSIVLAPNNEHSSDGVCWKQLRNREVMVV
jgi:hypothetical protein